MTAKTVYNTKHIDVIVRDADPLPVEIEPVCGMQFQSSFEVCEAFRNLIQLDKEAFIVLHLDGKNRIKTWQVVSVGTLTKALAHPREIFRTAVMTGAAGIIAIHVHPSGDPNPSTDDNAITARLKDAGKLLGITMLDHLVIGNGGRYYSYADDGSL